MSKPYPQYGGGTFGRCLGLDEDEIFMKGLEETHGTCFLSHIVCTKRRSMSAPYKMVATYKPKE